MAPADSAPQAVIDDQTPHHKPRIAAQDTGAHTASRKLVRQCGGRRRADDGDADHEQHEFDEIWA